VRGTGAQFAIANWVTGRRVTLNEVLDIIAEYKLIVSDFGRMLRDGRQKGI
jgi:hypothetical protein